MALLSSCLFGCVINPAASSQEDLSDRWYRYGQFAAFQSGGQVSDEMNDGGYLPPLWFMTLTGDHSAEATLLQSMLLFADSEESAKLMTDKFAQGTKNPADTRAAMFSDPFPKSQEEALRSLVEHHAGKGFRSEEARKVIHSKLDDSSFEIQAAYAKYYIERYAGGYEKPDAVAKKLDELELRATSKRQKEFWSTLQAVTKNKKPLSSKKEVITGRAACRQSMSTLASAQLACRVKKQTESFTPNLQDLLPMFEGKPLPPCSEGGTYSVATGVPARWFTIHCSIPEHDAGEPGEPSGYSPGLNSG
jgi:hypothetical protein